METIRLKAARTTQVNKLAGSISKTLDEDYRVEVIAIGAAAVNQTVKAIATSSGHAGSKGKGLLFKVGFEETFVDGPNGKESRTAMVFRIDYEE